MLHHNRWNVVEKDIEKLDTHKLRTVFRALQEMVIAWDVMPDERKAKMSTCEEVWHLPTPLPPPSLPSPRDGEILYFVQKKVELSEKF